MRQKSLEKAGWCFGEKLNYCLARSSGIMQPIFPLDALPQYPTDVLGAFAHLTSKPIIINGGYNQDIANQELRAGRAQLIAFGSLFLANPDLPIRFLLKAPLNQPDQGYWRLKTLAVTRTTSIQFFTGNGQLLHEEILPARNAPGRWTF